MRPKCRMYGTRCYKEVAYSLLGNVSLRIERQGPVMAHLYVMTRSDAPCLIKVGRSNNPERRAQDLHTGHCFTMKVMACIKHAGKHERAVHTILKNHRFQHGSGVEWFRCSLGQALAAIGQIVDGAADSDAAVTARARDVPLECRGTVASYFADILTPIRNAAYAMSASCVRHAISSHANVSTHVAAAAMNDAGWEEAIVNCYTSDEGRRTKKRVYRHCDDHNLFACARPRPSQQQG